MDEIQVRQQDRVQQQLGQQQLHEHLVDLQSWDRAPEQTIEQRRGQQADYMMQQEFRFNSNMRKYWRQECKSIQAKKTAEGQPVQIQTPAKKTYKQRREDKRLDAVAKEKNPVMDHISIRMMEGIEREKKLHEQSMDELTPEQRETIERNKIDPRVLETFTFGYKKNANGEPADMLHARRKKLDQKFLDDYSSGDLKRRRIHLNRILEQVLAIDITEEMFKPEYLEYHAGELCVKLDQLTYFDNISKDPINKEYFDELPQLTKDLLQYKVHERYAVFGAFFSTVCGLRGVDCNNVNYINLPAEDIRRNHGELFNELQEKVRKVLSTTRRQERELLQRTFDQVYQDKEADLLKKSDKNKQTIEREQMKTNGGADMSNLGLTAYAHYYSLENLADYRKLIEDSPQQYQKNAAIIDALYQQLYRSIDALGDLRLVTAATGGMMDDLKDAPPTEAAYSKALIQKAQIRQDEAEAKKTVMEEHINAMLDALRRLMSGKKLSKPGKQAIRQLGFKL